MKQESNTNAGFSMAELLIAMTIMLLALTIVMSLFSRSLATRSRESSRTDALTAAQAALNVMSREIANSGYGLTGNGIIAADSNAQNLHFYSNVLNTNSVLTDPGENLTFYFEPTSQSILRYDANGLGAGSGQVSVLINRVSSVNFQYFDYTGASAVGTLVTTPTTNTARVRITLTVNLERVSEQVNPQAVVLTSDVTLRNSRYMLLQY
jgi:prepilin-type N-terminal cleavage/methylation domain-containing protein